MIAILCTDGKMRPDEIKNECQPGKWAPLFSYRYKDEAPTIPVFQEESVARAFVRRNLPKDWVKGCVLLTPEDVENINKKGWVIREMNYPNKLTDIKDIKFGLEIIEFDEQPLFFVSRG